MTRRRKRTASAAAEITPEGTPPRRGYARWRALSLSLVYLVFAAHIIHWKVTGRTLAPLELNEVMYTLELGIVTAGFLFMCFLVLGTLLFGRFFCSWACHIMVLQDVCAWLLRRVGIRSKPLRSRVLLLVPPLAAFYMFVWPQVQRAWREHAFPTFHMATDADGWASFVTNNFWRNLPSPGIIALTFVVCGFVIIYVMGTRTFCTYVCPYGAIFGLVDRFSPGRIRVSDACRQCGQCTANCTSGVRVHEEVKKHGMIVNPACLKDLDCVAGCPREALSYGFSRPALLKSFKSGGRFGLPYDFSLREEVLIALVFVVVLLSFRGLYSRIPFLLSLALGGIIGYMSVLAIRLFSRPNVKLSTLPLKSLGKVTPGGRVFAAVSLLIGALVCHSALVRYHEYNGLRQVRALDGADGDLAAATAYHHLLAADRWGLMTNERVVRGILTTSARLGDFAATERYATRFLEKHPYDSAVRLKRGRALAELGKTDEARRQYRAIIASWKGAEESAPPALASAHHALGEMLSARGEFEAGVSEYRRALALDPTRAEVHAALGSALAELGRIDEAMESLRTAVQGNPDLGAASYNLGTLLAYTGHFEEAISYYERAIASGTEDSDVHNNLGFAMLQLGDADGAGRQFERAMEMNPDNADAHFNLAMILSSRRETELANEHFRRAARLDPRYARLIGEQLQR